MDIYDIITLCKKGLLIAKRYIALLLVFFVLGGVVGFVKAKVFKEEKYTSTALLFVDLNRDVIDTSNDMNESSKISMLANSFSQIVSSDSVIAPIAKQYALDSEDIDVENEDAVNTLSLIHICNCKIHLLPSRTASSSTLARSLPNF